MDRRSFAPTTLLILAALATQWTLSHLAPVSGASSPSSGRRLLQTSPIHFINPSLMAATGGAAHPLVLPSSVFRLPIKFLSNAKPVGVFAKPMSTILPQALSKIIRLPVKFMSNAKPIGVFFKKQLAYF